MKILCCKALKCVDLKPHLLEFAQFYKFKDFQPAICVKEDLCRIELILGF